MVIGVTQMNDESIATFSWDDTQEKVVLDFQTSDEDVRRIIQFIYDEEYVFDPEGEELIEDDCKDFWDGFVLKICPLILKYGMKYVTL